MNEPTTAMVAVEKIAVEEGFNPRERFDEGDLAELTASIREQGILSALTLRNDGGGGYVLIAGARRLKAARLAGLKEVPALIRAGNGDLAAAIAENLIRADLDPIEEARALKRLAEAEKLTTHKQIAARIGKSPTHVSERLRLLALPEACQTQIAAAAVPVAAERDLRKVAKVSPAVAEGLCELVRRGELEGRDLLDRFDEALGTLEQAEFEGAPTMVDARGARLSELVGDPERHAELAARLNQALPSYQRSEDPSVRLGDQECDAARAAGCLLEHTVDQGGWSSTSAYVCDAELAADLAERLVERIEKQAAEAERSRAQLRGQGTEDEGSVEAAKEARREERQRAKAEAAAARTFNLDLGRRLIARRGAKSRKEHSLARARALATLVLHDNGQLAAAGLRLALPQLQEVETKQLASGEERERVSYRDAEECRVYLANRIAEARTANEVLELLADAMVAAVLADDRELAQSRRIGWHSFARLEVEKLLAPEIKSVRPRRSRARK